jgi:hypothetical protein
MQAAPSPTSGDVTSAAAATVRQVNSPPPLLRGDVAALPTVTTGDTGVDSDNT